MSIDDASDFVDDACAANLRSFDVGGHGGTGDGGRFQHLRSLSVYPTVPERDDLERLPSTLKRIKIYPRDGLDSALAEFVAKLDWLPLLARVEVRVDWDTLGHGGDDAVAEVREQIEALRQACALRKSTSFDVRDFP